MAAGRACDKNFYYKLEKLPLYSSEISNRKMHGVKWLLVLCSLLRVVTIPLSVCWCACVFCIDSFATDWAFESLPGDCHIKNNQLATVLPTRWRSASCLVIFCVIMIDAIASFVCLDSISVKKLLLHACHHSHYNRETLNFICICINNITWILLDIPLYFRPYDSTS